MSFSLLQLVDQSSGEMGLAQPPSVIGSAVNQTIQLLALTQRLGKDLLRRFQWNKANKIYVFSTTPALTKTGTTTAGSAVIASMSNTTTLAAGMVITGTGIAPYAEILSVDSATQVTMNTPASAAGTAITLTFAYQDYAPPSDFDRMVPDTNWDRTDHWHNEGSVSPQAWGWLQGGIISTGPRVRFRIYNGNLRIFPALTTAFNFSFEYVSSSWVLATGGTAATKSAFSVDSDTCIFPDDLMLAGIKYYFRRAKGFDYSMDITDFERCCSIAMAQDVPVSTKSLSPQAYPELIGPNSIPDGNWGL